MFSPFLFVLFWFLYLNEQSGSANNNKKEAGCSKDETECGSDEAKYLPQIQVHASRT